MPLYEYKCGTCGYRFEELVGSLNSGDVFNCKKCGFPALRQMSSFAAVVAGGSPNETIDMTIGREAGKRWQGYYDKQAKRHSQGTMIPKVSAPVARDGKFMPVMALGDHKEKSNRQEYVGALQEHRSERIKKGQSQFSGPGEF